MHGKLEITFDSAAEIAEVTQALAGMREGYGEDAAGEDIVTGFYAGNGTEVLYPRDADPDAVAVAAAWLSGAPGVRHPNATAVLHSDSAGVRVTFPRKTDPRAVLATVAELLGIAPAVAALDEVTFQRLTPDELEDLALRNTINGGVGAGWLRGVAAGIREGERRAAVQIPDLMTRTHSDGVVEGERRERAMWQRETGVSAPEDLKPEAARCVNAMLDEARTVAREEGIAEGERRAKAKAEEILTSWGGRIDTIWREIKMLDPSSDGSSVRRARVSALSECGRALQATFGLPDGQPPTGGEPAPDGEGPAHGPGCDVRNGMSQCTFDCPKRRADMAKRSEVVALAATTDHVEPAPAADERWQPGAVWEHRIGVSGRINRLEIARISSNGRYAEFCCGGWEPRTAMTAEHGWRYVGRGDGQKSAPEPNANGRELVRVAMERAVAMFGDRGDGAFSGACFSAAFCELTGLVGPVDGHVVRGMLTGRSDVRIESDRSQYRLLPVDRDERSAIERARAARINPAEMAFEFAGRVEPQPPADADERWQPGAVWEHRAGSLPDVATFTLQRVDPNGDVAFLDVNGRACWSTREDMTGGTGCGWRYVGRPASEMKTEERPAVRAADRAPVVPGQASAEERAAVEAGKAGPFIPHAEVMAGVCERAHADGIVEGLCRADGIVRSFGRRGEMSPEHIAALDVCIGTAIAEAGQAAPANREPAVDRAALLALADGWQREATQYRKRARPPQDGRLDTESASAVTAAVCVERCASDLRRLLDAPRGPGGGKREAGEEEHEALALSELRRVHHADHQPEPADLTERWRARWARLERAHEGAAGAFDRGYLRGLCDAYRCAEVDMVGWLYCRSDAEVGAPIAATDREALGRAVRAVRAVWVAWAHEQPAPKASWLAPWEALAESDREADRRIGERLYAMGAAAGRAELEALQKRLGEAEAAMVRIAEESNQALKRAAGEVHAMHARVVELESELAKARDEIDIDNELLKHRAQLLDALPCDLHGPCVPHALQEIARLREVERRAASVREQGAAEMREMACDAVVELAHRGGLILVEAEQVVHAIRAIPLSSHDQIVDRVARDGLEVARVGAQDLSGDALLRAGWRKDGELWRDPSGSFVDPGTPFGQEAMRRGVERLRADLFVSLPREEFEKLSLISEDEIQVALDRGRRDAFGEEAFPAAPPADARAALDAGGGP
ncbi:hypothetical protein [Sorangium sp. So ce233]|uniref:hypothetical protein n=1 Tax=Sorangium sp. So ce233 TaxID=3133290 RepID=UPI003F5F60C7